ncbi:MAG TPA: LiaF domain-containing protein [Actinomycetota bacterium]|nr:LiaF domain-containing protein [Actinomycetota bacterium]
MSEPTVPLPPPAEPRPSPRMGRLLGGVLLVLLGAAWLLESLDVVQVPWDVLLPGGLIAIGVILVVNSPTGASHRGMIALGIVLTVLLSMGTVIALPVGGGIGERTERPTTADQAAERFELGIGQFTMDLRELPVPAAGTEPVLVRARLGIGELVVIVPEGVAVRVEAKAGLGTVKVFDKDEGGLDVDLVSEPAGAAPALDLRLSVGIGEVSVQRG